MSERFESQQEEVLPPKEIELFRRVVGDTNRLFGKKFGIFVPEADLPTVVKGSRPVFENYENVFTGKGKNFIKVKDINQLLEGWILGEEMCHFYRHKFRPDSPDTPSESLTDEFFGWLGRRLLFEATKKDDGTSDFFPEDEPKINADTKRKTLKRIKGASEEIRDLIDKGELTLEEIMERSQPLHQAREDDLRHFRGYEFASKLDLYKITDWKKLFSLPDREVRKRFFTPTPDYSGL